MLSIPFNLCITVLVSAGLLVLSDIGGRGIFSAALFNSPRGVIVLAAVPFALLCFTGIYLYSIIADSLSRREVTRTGVRIFLSFCLLIALSAVPATVTVGRFSGTAVSTWFSRELSSSLLSAADIARLYTAERHRVLEKAALRYFNGLAITNYKLRHPDWMSDILTVDPLAVSCQVYAVDRKDPGHPVITPVHESGDSGKFVPLDSLMRVTDGIFSLEPIEDVYRYGKVVRYSGVEYICALTSMIPDGFHARLRAIELAYSQSLVIDRLKPHLPMMGVWVFALFCLPLLLLLVALAWALAMRIASPLKTVQDMSARLASRDGSLRVIPHGGDEIAAIGEHLNEAASSMELPARRKNVIQL